MKTRTVKDYVADMRANGRNKAKILAVAQQTRWHDSLADIRKELEGKK